MIVNAGDEERVWAPIGPFLRFLNPLEEDPWGCLIRTEDVDLVLAEGDLLATPVPIGCEDRWVHAARIAYLVVNGWKDEIVFEPERGWRPGDHLRHMWPVTDGNHRLAAAIYRGDEEILAIISGDTEAAMDFLGEVRPEHEPDLADQPSLM